MKMLKMKDFIFITGASGIGKTILANGLLEYAINIIEITPAQFDYEYRKPLKEKFYSWVFANGVR